MKHIYILSCEKTGGIYHYLFENGKFQFIEKTPLDRPMYAIIRDNKMYAILREIDKKTHFGGILSFDIAENGSIINPINLKKVRNFDLSLSGTICVTLSDGTATYVSRRYVSKIKKILGL